VKRPYPDDADGDALLAAYDTVVDLQSDLNGILQPHGGHCDG
jgi:hypothetical protein